MIDANKLMSSMSNTVGSSGYKTETSGNTGFIETPGIPDQDVSFDTILTRCGFDPDEYEVDGTPTVKRWEAQTPDGVEWLSSYGIKVRKRVVDLPEEDIEERIERLRSFTPALRKNRHGSGERVAAVVNLADLQAYKSEGGGIEGLTQRLTDGLENVQAWVDRCRSSYNVEEIILVNNGDAVEGCFQGDTMVLTDRGYRPIRDLADEGAATIRTDYGKWVDAPFKSFGSQQLYRLELDRMGARKVIYTTGSHRWLTKSGNNRIDKLTTHLAKGDYLASVFGAGGTTLEPSRFGIAHGVVFGDGHRDDRNGRAECALMLYKNKWELGEYLNDPTPTGPYQRSAGEEPYLKYSRLPGRFKDLPDLGESTTYLAGWLAGYIATDGSVGTTVALSSAARENLEAVESVAAIIGIGTNPIQKRTFWNTPPGGSPREVTVYRISFIRSTFPESLLLRANHREALGKMPPRDRKSGHVVRSRQWSVVSAEPTGRWEDVYCAVVPGTHTFAIEGNILTGNCAGNYDSQLFTVSGTHRQQYNYALDAWDVYARNLFPQFEHRQFVSVLSNHGEMGRFGTSRNKTSDSDSADGFLAETLKRVYDSTDEFADVEWTIPHDQMNVYTQTRQGVKLALNHGHKIKGSDASAFEKWLSGQARGDRDAWEADIWITAHRHNFQAWDLGSCSAFQCPSMDGGSKWLRDMNGRYSNSGILAFLVGQHSKTKWSDLAFL